MIGGAQKSFSLWCMGGIARHAYRTRQVEATPDTEAMNCYCSSHFLRQCQGFVCLQLRQDCHEFLTAPASHRIHVRQLRPDKTGKLTQHRVASRMPVAIIERFE